MDIELEALINSLDVFGFELLPLHPAHTLLLATLPLFHRDPFDRMLIAQAISEGFQLLTADPAFEAYKVQLIKI
jgi:PIN domain nuclease of toxin-antitoxin system